MRRTTALLVTGLLGSYWCFACSDDANDPGSETASFGGSWSLGGSAGSAVNQVKGGTSNRAEGGGSSLGGNGGASSMAQAGGKSSDTIGGATGIGGSSASGGMGGMVSGGAIGKGGDASGGGGGVANSAGTAGIDCQCAKGGFAPVCGVDGTTYDATCGRACVVVTMACNGQCPCNAAGAAGNGGVAGGGGTSGAAAVAGGSTGTGTAGAAGNGGVVGGGGTSGAAAVAGESTDTSTAGSAGAVGSFGAAGSAGACQGALPGAHPGCECYSDSDCASGQRCYGADCSVGTLGRCGVAPSVGCYDSSDCRAGEVCNGGQLAPCGTTMPDSVGTCTVGVCGNLGAACAKGQACVRYDVGGVAFVTSWQCMVNPCTVGFDCACGANICGGNHCSLWPADSRLHDFDVLCIPPSRCASPETPIATPRGEVAISELLPGDLVLSIHRGQLRAVPILAVSRVPVSQHQVQRVSFDDGSVVEMSAGHPTADGRPLAALEPGSMVGERRVVSNMRLPYGFAYTHDILPASDSGSYFAKGVAMGSTLHWRHSAVASSPPFTLSPGDGSFGGMKNECPGLLP